MFNLRSSLLKVKGLAIGLVFLLAACGVQASLIPPASSAATELASPPAATLSTKPSFSLFPMGVFEDGNQIGGKPEKFAKMLSTLQGWGLDSVLVANTFLLRDTKILTVSDQQNFNVFMMPAGDLNPQWWPAKIPADPQLAQQIAQPIVATFGAHPSLKGYLVKDEPSLQDLPKVALLTQALQKLDPSRISTSVLVGVNRVEEIFNASQPGVMLLDIYPVGAKNALGDFRLTGFGYQDLDFVAYLRQVGRSRPPNVPLWVILQTHSFAGGQNGQFALREPLPAEVRAQQWLALGEGATGIFWFVYGSQQGWRGLVDNPELATEVTTLTHRLKPLRKILLGLQKEKVDLFQIREEPQGYLSTLTDKTKKVYLIVVNRDCTQPKALKIASTHLRGQLKDLETGQSYPLNRPIEFRPGDGKLFEFLSAEG